MYLHDAHAPLAGGDPHQHTPTEPQRWRAAAQLLPAIDRHGWIEDYRPLSTRTIHTRLHLAAARATTNPAGPDGAARPTQPPVVSGGQGSPKSPRAASDLADVLEQLDQVAADADALNARIEALLAGTETPAVRPTWGRMARWPS